MHRLKAFCVRIRGLDLQSQWRNWILKLGILNCSIQMKQNTQRIHHLITNHDSSWSTISMFVSNQKLHFNNGSIWKITWKIMTFVLFSPLFLGWVGFSIPCCVSQAIRGRVHWLVDSTLRLDSIIYRGQGAKFAPRPASNLNRHRS